MKIVDKFKDECIGNIFTIDELDCIMEEVKYFPYEHDDEDEEGILKYSNGRSEIWFKFSVKDECEYLISDVTYKVKKNGKTQVHAFKNPEDIKHMMDYFRNEKKDDCLLVFVFGLTLARRIGDTFSLKWGDFFYQNGNRKTILYTILEQKTKKIVEIKINNTVFEYLEWYRNLKGINLYNSINIDIFDSEEKAKLRQMLLQRKISIEEYNTRYKKILKEQAASFRYYFKKAADFNGIEGVSTHSMRKTFGYWAHKLNPYDVDNIDVLKSIFGHSSRETTKIYIDVMSDKANKLYDDVGNFITNVDNGSPILIENSPVITLKTEDFRDIINMAYKEGKESNGDMLDEINKIISEAENRRIV